MASGNLDISVGRAVYTTFLNSGGGIENDAPVSRMSEFRYGMTTGAAMRRKELAQLRRSQRGCSVLFSNMIETEAVIGVMGPREDRLLSSFSPDDWTGFA